MLFKPILTTLAAVSLLFPVATSVRTDGIFAETDSQGNICYRYVVLKDKHSLLNVRQQSNIKSPIVAQVPHGTALKAF